MKDQTTAFIDLVLSRIMDGSHSTFIDIMISRLTEWSSITPNQAPADTVPEQQSEANQTRVGILIEENLSIAARNRGQKLPLKEIMNFAEKIGEVVFAKVYASHSPDKTGEEWAQRFRTACKYVRFEADLKPRSTNSHGAIKSRVDQDLAFSLAKVAIQLNLTHIVLGSGDGDFTNVVLELKKMGVLVTLITPGPGCTSPDLVAAATNVVSFADLVPIFAPMPAPEPDHLRTKIASPKSTISERHLLNGAHH